MSDTFEYPRIYLAIDNCFASKRWTEPAEWLDIIKDLGLRFVEASADNECDPLYGDADYLKSWQKQIKKQEKISDMKVVNLYSGHGTYATLGLAHTDVRGRDRILNQWLKEMVKIASELNAGLGFFCHAFNQKTLQDSAAYYKAKEDLYDRLAQLSSFASEKNIRTIGVEQMYTPHQIPWTIEGTTDLLKEVFAKSGHPFYITIDTGHQSGQRKFLQPDYDKVRGYLGACREKGFVEQMWLGSEKAYNIFNAALPLSSHDEDAAIKNIISEMNAHPYFFAKYNDGDPYIWLEELACWSPIIHLQQTNGASSSHWAFTEKHNKQGIITGEKVLEAIFRSYSREKSTLLPQSVKEIYLTLEIFSATADINIDIISRLKKSVEYWRKFIPEDGEKLNEIIKRIQMS
jgi:sugar phosphate isomerase/epimerase